MCKISVVTICFNNLEDLKRTCRSVDEQSEYPYEHWIIDGSKTNDISDWLVRKHVSAPILLLLRLR